jgi:hypothetical protein
MADERDGLLANAGFMVGALDTLRLVRTSLEENPDLNASEGVMTFLTKMIEYYEVPAKEAVAAAGVKITIRREEG